MKKHFVSVKKQIPHYYILNNGREWLESHQL